MVKVLPSLTVGEHEFDLVFISRRGCQRVGTRFNKRGLDAVRVDSAVVYGPLFVSIFLVLVFLVGRRLTVGVLCAITGRKRGELCRD